MVASHAVNLSAGQSSVDRSLLQRRLFTGLYWLVVLLYCGWVLSMPVYPSQDGPLHLYYANVLRHLLSGSHNVYTATYTVGRHFPPYATYYYLLVGLSYLVPFEVADKLVVCLVFVLFGWAVRRLARVTGGDDIFAPFLILPILFNWPVMEGLLSFSLGTVFGLFALEAWCRNACRPSAVARIAYLLLLVMVILSHAVAFLFVVGFTFAELLLRRLRRDAPRLLGADVATALAGAAGIVYLLSFRNIAVAAEPQGPHHFSIAGALRLNAGYFAKQFGLSLFGGTAPEVLVYRILLLVLTVVAVVLAARSLRTAWRSPAGYLASVWGVYSLVLFCVLPLVPNDINGGYFFAIRLMVSVLAALVVAASFSMPAWRGDGGRVLLAAACAAFSIFVLALSNRMLAPYARAVASLEDAPAVVSPLPGLLLDRGAYGDGLQTNPFNWAPAAYMRQHGLLMYNTPWLETAIIPVKVRPDALPRVDCTYLTSPVANFMPVLRLEPGRDALLGRVGFTMGMHTHIMPNATPFFDGRPQDHGWTCQSNAYWTLCQRAANLR